MTTATQENKGYISLKTIGGAIILTALLYAGLFGYVKLNASSTLQEIEERFDSRLIPLNTSDDLEVKILEEDNLSNPQTTSHPQINIQGLDTHETTTHGVKSKSSDFSQKKEKKPSPFNLYKKEFPITRKPLIALVAMDYGLSEKASNALLNELPHNITLMMNPYSDNPTHWQKTAQQEGFELWLDLPITSKNILGKDNGSHSLQEDASLDANNKNLKWLLSRITSYAGVGASFSSSMQSNIPLLKNILTQLTSRELGIFDTSLSSADMFNEHISPKAISLSSPVSMHKVSLKEIEKIAKKNGYVIVTMYPYPRTIEAIKIWEDTLALKGLAIAPLSVITTRNAKKEAPHTKEETEKLEAQHVDEVHAMPPDEHENPTHH